MEENKEMYAKDNEQANNLMNAFHVPRTQPDMNSCKSFFDNRVITVFLLIPRICIKKIKLDITHKFNSFYRVFNNTKKLFIHNGNIVDPTKTLDFYGVSNNDGIVACDLETNADDLSLWKSITADIFHFNEKIQEFIVADPMMLAKQRDMKRTISSKPELAPIVQTSMSKLAEKINYSSMDSHKGPYVDALPLI